MLKKYFAHVPIVGLSGFVGTGCTLKDDLKKNNPWAADTITSDKHWHECWYCGGCHETNAKVKKGIPYWVLRLFGNYATRKAEDDPQTYAYYEKQKEKERLKHQEES